jgi:serine protease AprX
MDVINLSLGHPIYEPPEQDPLVQEVDELSDSGVLVVCSAGNNGRAGDGTISSPCNSRKVVTVGALNDHDTVDTADETVASFSSRGPTRFTLTAKPDILSPGNRIVSLRSLGSILDLQFPERRVSADPAHPEQVEHFEMSGTSMAAPMVAATAALMFEQTPWLSPPTVKARLLLTARKASVGNPFATGAGALDITAALRATGSGQVGQALSPLVFTDAASGRLGFENTGQLWGHPAFSCQALWCPRSTGRPAPNPDSKKWSDGVPGWISIWPPEMGGFELRSRVAAGRRNLSRCCCGPASRRSARRPRVPVGGHA